MKWSWQRAKASIKLLLQRKASSHELAGGLALGVAVGIMMPYGIHIAIAVFLAWLLRVDKIAAVLGTFVNSPFTAGPIYFLAWRIGRRLYDAKTNLSFPGDFSGMRFEEVVDFFLKIGPDALLTIFLGLLVITIPATLMAYGVGLWWVRFMRSRKKNSRSKVNHLSSCPSQIPEKL